MTLLLSGLDTVECAYFLRPSQHCMFDFNRLALEKERLRLAKKREALKIDLGGTEFLLQAYGSSSGLLALTEN